ncbi:MAG: hypothetical protein K1060chlam4_00721 [Candidatus Anoxychlamydiales bacterium]|nr:hypothetical protein [Candidatus Anoxychlamydiales bacterium]
MLVFFFMAQYKTHSTFNIFLALPLFLWAIVYFFHPQLNLIITFSACFAYATLFMNPDQDITNKIKLFSIRGFLTLPFRGYSLIFKHRGISHSFILGTTTRVLWLGGFFYGILYVLDKPFFKRNELIAILKSDHFLYGFSAIILADFCHLLLDFKHKK